MAPEEARELLSEILMYCDFTDEYGDYINDEPYLEALEMGNRAIELVEYLTDRPCEVCVFHKDGNCSRWNCVFEEGSDNQC